MDQTAKRYLNQVGRALACPKGERERLLADVGTLVEEFAQETPGAFYNDYVSAFGPPKDFAQELMARVDPETVRLYRQRRQRLGWAVVLVLAALAVFLLGRWSLRRSDPAPAPSVESAPAVSVGTPGTAATPGPAGTPAATETSAPSETPAAAESPAPAESPETSAPPAADFAQKTRDYVAKFFDGEEIQYPEGVAVAHRLGLIMGKEDGSYFDPKGNVTRGEAAKLLAMMMNGGRELPSGMALKETPSFPDIGGHWAEEYIEYCFDMGMAFGDMDGNFDPNGNITGMELVRMLLCALGYNAEAYRLVGEDWAARTNEVAMTTVPYGLYDGLSGVKMNDPVTREAATQLICNALRSAPMMVFPVQIPDGTVAWEYRVDKDAYGDYHTLLQQRFEIDRVEDIEF